MNSSKKLRFSRRPGVILAGAMVITAVTCGLILNRLRGGSAPPLKYEPRTYVDTSGFSMIATSVPPWGREASLSDIASAWTNAGRRIIAPIDQRIARPTTPDAARIPLLASKAMALNFEGDAAGACEVLERARALAQSSPRLAERFLHTIIYFQGVSAMRQGENENCIMCRGEGSCILPISASARHQKPSGSRQAIRHFGEYLETFPDDLEVRWLLNLAHMTLGEYPDQVPPRFRILTGPYSSPEFDIGRFRDIGTQAGVNRFNQAGGAIMEDFDNDGKLDLVVSSIDVTQSMSFFRNSGDGTFKDLSREAGVVDQLGGLYCVQADYDNDGFMDIYIARGAWLLSPIRPTLLRNRGDGTFADVTAKAGLLDPVNSNSAAWADYDNDGWLDLFVCCEKQPNRLYHSRRDGTFEEVADKAGVDGLGRSFCKGCNWIDYDNDGDPDLFLNYLSGLSQLYRNNGDGTFSIVNGVMGVEGPYGGFSCWAWDYDNDGWLDIFATCYDRTTKDVIKGLMGQPHESHPNKLFHNVQGKRFEDVTREAGLDIVFAAMGSNFGDFDNDGFLDFYLGTGEPNLATLIPNRMFKNVGGRRFAEITTSAGTGHLQKGHAIACGDWDRDGDVDIFLQAGGAVNGDKAHNVLFDNPGQGNHWLTLKLVGRKTNRAAIGARIKVVTGGEDPLTVHRHVSSGSSFGANPLQQTIGLARGTKVATLEVHWPTSGTTQAFHDIDADQAIEVTEFADGYRKLDWTPIPTPE